MSDLAAPFAVGLAVGYFSKKLLRVGLFLLGMAVVLLLVGENLGWLELREESLLLGAEKLGRALLEVLRFLEERLDRIALKGVSAAAGFLVGLKLG